MGRHLHPPMGVSISMGNAIWQDDETGKLSFGPGVPGPFEVPLSDLEGCRFYERFMADFAGMAQETAANERMAEVDAERDRLRDREPDPADHRPDGA
jgi:hypothetical protein